MARRLPLALALVLSALAPARAQDARDVRPHAGMMRTPDVSATHVVFAYANDLWTVPREGGRATPLAAPPGPVSFPRFAPDGRTIAFVGNYDGGTDLYTVPLEGGVPRRVTHHPAAEVLCDWTADGRLLFFARGTQGQRRQEQLFTVAPEGGLPALLPVPYGAFGAIDATGTWLAYAPHTHDWATWKRYQGGMATDLWLFHLRERTARRVTDWSGTDSQPMWHGERLYYVSDAGPEHRLNVWVFEPATGARRQVTRFAQADVRFPAVGPGPDGKGEVVFSVGRELRLLDLATEASRALDVVVPGARPTLRPRRVDAARVLGPVAPSPTGKRVVVEARGDVWTLPAERGAPRVLEATSGAAEREPAWSPDGRAIAYFSDATGEYELWVRPADGSGAPRRLTRDGAGHRLGLVWSPDSARLAHGDKAGRLFLTVVETGETALVDQHPGGRLLAPRWSPDGRWLAYSRPAAPRRQPALWLHDVEQGARHQVTSGAFADVEPCFDRAGKLLLFASSRAFRPSYGDLETSFVYGNTQALLAVPLQRGAPSPFAPRVDEEPSAPAAPGEEPAKPAGPDGPAAPGEEPAKPAAPAKPAPVVIDLEGFERRAVPLPVEPGVFRGLAVAHDGALLYVRTTSRGFPGEASLRRLDLAEPKGPRAEGKDARGDGREEEVVSAGPLDGFALTADGKLALVRAGDRLAYHEPKAGAKPRPVSTDGMHVEVAPRAEWRQLLREAWRLQRDFFYDAGLHGVDWPAVWAQHEAMLPDCATREDVSVLIREMISELNVGHAYYGGGDEERPPVVPVGLLGCDFERVVGEDGRAAYRIARIVEGAPWDDDGRGPLSQPGVDVAAGDYLLAVEGRPVDPARDPWAAFVGLAGETVTLTVSARPALDEAARRVVVTCLASEDALRYRAWVEARRARVAAATGGRVGYVHVPDTGVNGQNELVRQLFGQLHTEALIVDDRWNGGGQIPTRFVELLNRPLTNLWALRDGADWVWPPDAHHGPKCMLINGLAGSGGDAFPAYFRQAGLGKLIGTRTWGGLVGISGNPRLIDGGGVTVPTFGYYTRDGRWSIEGHGVDPDVEVVDDPAAMQGDVDVQLEAAIRHLLAELERSPPRLPARPAGPDRRGMGIDPGHR